MNAFLHKLFNEQKFVRRATLAWAVWLITTVALRMTAPTVVEKFADAAANVAVAVIGLLAVVISFYQWSRSREDKKDAN